MVPPGVVRAPRVVKLPGGSGNTSPPPHNPWARTAGLGERRRTGVRSGEGASNGDGDRQSVMLRPVLHVPRGTQLDLLLKFLAVTERSQYPNLFYSIFL